MDQTDPNELQRQLDESDIESVGKFMKMFDRMLLYTLAVNFLPRQAINGTVDLWDQVIKKGIDADATGRTEFLEGTTAGRLSTYKDEPDGEELRLHFLKQYEIARKVILSNLDKDRFEQEKFDTDDLDDLDLEDGLFS